VAPPHWASLAQPWHVFVCVSQTGFAPPHWALVLHVVQIPAATSQLALGPVQALLFVAEHTPQAPEGWQAGPEIDPLQSVSPAQPRQAWVVPSQKGVAPPHWAFDVQPTQVPVAALQAGVVPPQRPGFVAEHWPHAPFD
jgi:hypothetical protein